MEKYDKDGPFTDPLVRCSACNKIIKKESLLKHGMCPLCGNKRVTNLMIMSADEMNELKDSGIDPDFLALFEAKEEK